MTSCIASIYCDKVVSGTIDTARVRDQLGVPYSAFLPKDDFFKPGTTLRRAGQDHSVGL